MALVRRFFRESPRSDYLVLVESGDADVAQVQDGLGPQVLQGVTPLQLQLFQSETNFQYTARNKLCFGRR